MSDIALREAACNECPTCTSNGQLKRNSDVGTGSHSAIEQVLCAGGEVPIKPHVESRVVEAFLKLREE